MQQPQCLTEPNTAPRAVAGQFEDADDDEEVEIIGGGNPSSSGGVLIKNKQLSSPTVPQKLITSATVPWKSALTKTNAVPSLKTASSIPPPCIGLQRRISSNTTEATKALLAIAASGGGGLRAKKKKTFLVRLEELKEYRDRHGGRGVPRRDPLPTDEPWEQNLLAWVQDCRRQFAEGTFSLEKAKALHDLGCEGFEIAFGTATMRMMPGDTMEATGPEVIKPEAQSHPALRALWLKRQQDEARLMQQMRRASGMNAAGAGMLGPSRRCLDPDGASPPEEDVYPEEAALMMKKNREQEILAAREREAGMALSEMQLKEAAARSQRLAIQEMHARETLAREAMMREQMLMREQRIAQAMAAQRRMSMGGFGPGLTGSSSSNPRGLLSSQPGRVMSLLQPLESVPPRADPMLGMSGPGLAPGSDARFNALLQAQMMQRRASLQASSDVMLRRPSDASSVERRPSEMGSAPRRPSDMGSVGGGGADQPRVRKTWDERMKEMWSYFLTYGHTQVQTRGEHRELGRWLSNTRCRLRDGLLPQHLAKEFLAMERWTLEDGGPKHMDPPEEEVMEGVASRRASMVGSSSQRMPGDVLATPPTQIKVKSLGQPSPKGKTKRALPKSWHQSFTELQQFKEKFGHCDVKMIVNSPYGLLGKWLASQRSRHKLGQLPVDKVNRLREIGCNGFAQGGKIPHRSQYRADDEEAEFDQALRSLKDDGEEGDPNSPPCSPATREKRVRHSYETRVEHIKAFREKHGHVKIRLGSSDKHEELLARWLASARSRYRGGQFKEERAAELRALGCDGFDSGNFDEMSPDEDGLDGASRKREAPTRTATPSPTPSGDQDDGSEPPSKKQRGGGKRQSFDDMLKELESYQYVFGVGCSVPKPDGEKGKLGRWLAFQRRQFIAGKLSGERIEKLKGIGRKEFNKSALIVRAAERAAASIHNEH